MELLFEDLYILLEVVRITFWLGGQKMVKISDERGFLKEVTFHPGKTNPQQSIHVYMVSDEVALETTHREHFLVLSSFSSHILCLKNTNELKY